MLTYDSWNGAEARWAIKGIGLTYAVALLAAAVMLAALTPAWAGEPNPPDDEYIVPPDEEPAPAAIPDDGGGLSCCGNSAPLLGIGLATGGLLFCARRRDS